MHVSLVGGTGRAGGRIMRELVDRGHRVRMIVRTAPTDGATYAQEVVVDGLSDVEKMSETIRGTDAVISAYAPPAENTDALVDTCHTLTVAVERSGVSRLLVVGGAGVLEVAPTVTLLQSGKLPAEWTAIAASHVKALAALRTATVNWTYVAPAAFFDPGKRTGRYRTAGERLVMDENGESRISMEDYAIALVDELENARYPRAVCSVGW